MRTVLVAIFLILYTLLSLPMYLVAYLAGKKDEKLKVRISQKFVAWGLRCILFLSGVKVTVKGKENIPSDDNALFVFNHRSYYDIIVAYVTAPIPTAFVAKKELAKLPMISQWMRYLQCLFLDRDDMRQGMKTIMQGIALMKDGTNLFIAPEGTRNDKEELLPFHAASFKLAEKSKKPIVPVAMNNMDAVWEQHMPWIRKTHVIIEYCQPIYMDQMERDEKKKIGETVRAILAKKIEENKKEL